MQKLYESIALLGRQYGAAKVVLFGSRARGDNRDRSDIDLAVYDMPEDNQPGFWMDLDELPTLLKFDIVHITPDTDLALQQNIKKDGVILYEKM